MAQIIKLISNKKPGTVFTARDFQDVAENSAIRQSLKRLTENGTIRRIAHGIYDKPGFSPFLNELEEADIYQTAQIIARNNNWTIAPSGNIALNLLGLSTQVSSSWSFVSDGPYKEYTIGFNTIEFKHRANREITGMSEKTILIIQALKTLGKERITDTQLAKIQKQLTVNEKKELLLESRNASAWIVEAIHAICKEI
ncbi:MAG TPA: hypothetical protein DCG32_01255 [Sphaerochaeta sp.]|nr:hypothetical protein [Sphaerochaeta sp.]